MTSKSTLNALSFQPLILPPSLPSPLTSLLLPCPSFPVVQPKAKPPSPSSSSSASDLISSDVLGHPVFLYMKGNPAQPKCGFSANVVRILQHLGASFSSRDVLEDGEVREAVKKFSDWPTLPQLYVGGEFVGGSDIITQMFKNGELEKILQQAGAITAQPGAGQVGQGQGQGQVGQGAAQ